MTRPEWETEAMHAYRGGDAAAAARGSTTKQQQQQQRTKKKPSSGGRKGSGRRKKAAAAAAEDDWVFVETAGRPIPIGPGRRQVMVLPPRKSKGGKVPPVVVTRDMTDTTFNRVYKRPLPHNYGRANTRPAADANYLKTFNMRAADADEGQVFASTLRAFASAQARTKHSASASARAVSAAAEEEEENPAAELLALAAADDAITAEAQAAAAWDGVPASPSREQGVQTGVAPPGAPAFGERVFGVPSKPRDMEPSMFEILAWPGA